MRAHGQLCRAAHLSGPRRPTQYNGAPGQVWVQSMNRYFDFSWPDRDPDGTYRVLYEISPDDKALRTVDIPLTQKATRDAVSFHDPTDMRWEGSLTEGPFLSALPPNDGESGLSWR